MATSKPIQNMRAYGKIGHLPGSRLGDGDHHVNDGQTKMCLVQAKEEQDQVIVQEKYDGACMAVLKHEGQIIPLIRRGYPAAAAKREHQRMFAAWVYERHYLFDRMLDEGERAVGEWLALAHGTLYDINTDTDAWVMFDVMTGENRMSSKEISTRMSERGVWFTRPEVLHYGPPLDLVTAERLLKRSPHEDQGPVAFGMPEGVVYRVEREGRTILIAKWVRTDKEDGRFLDIVTNGPEVWNWRPDGQGLWRDGFDAGKRPV